MGFDLILYNINFIILKKNSNIKLKIAKKQIKVTKESFSIKYSEVNGIKFFKKADVVLFILISLKICMRNSCKTLLSITNLQL